MNEIIKPINQLLSQANETLSHSMSRASKIAYGYDYQGFLNFCVLHNCSPHPVAEDTLIAYLQFLKEKGLAPSSIKRALISISKAQKCLGLPDPKHFPQVVEMYRAITRTTSHQKRQVKPLTWKQLVTICERIEELYHPNRKARDRSFLLLGWCGALRRSEIIGLRWKHVKDDDQGLLLYLPKSKTDQEGLGFHVPIPFSNGPICPVRELAKWRDLLKPSNENEAIFCRIFKGDLLPNKRKTLTDKAISLLIKDAVYAVGWNPDNYSGHSLRSGFITTAAELGIEERLIMQHTRHKSLKIMREYIRDGRQWTNDNPLKRIFSN